jgi:hypothetical protein
MTNHTPRPRAAFHRAGRWFVSFRVPEGFVLIAVHLRWRFKRVTPPGKPGYTRWYLGPIEIERSAIAKAVGQA